jgi:peptide deformylase
MYQSSGIGLAANQVGVTKRVIIFDINYKEKGKDLTVFQGKITRKKYIQVQGIDRHGKTIDIEAEDLAAICIQHEIDHLDGTLILDHVSHLKRTLYKRKAEKLMKRSDNGQPNLL